MGGGKTLKGSASNGVLDFFITCDLGWNNERTIIGYRKVKAFIVSVPNLFYCEGEIFFC